MVKFHINKESAFTLIELLIVLLIVSIVSLFILPSMHQTMIRQKQKHFFELYSSDIFYIQNTKLYTDKYAEIIPLNTHYNLNPSNEGIKRMFPEELRKTNAQPDISFSRKGTIKQPYTYIYTSKDTKYSIIFPFGKGRSYLVEE